MRTLAKKTNKRKLSSSSEGSCIQHLRSSNPCRLEKKENKKRGKIWRSTDYLAASIKPPFSTGHGHHRGTQLAQKHHSWGKGATPAYNMHPHHEIHAADQDSHLIFTPGVACSLSLSFSLHPEGCPDFCVCESQIA